MPQPCARSQRDIPVPPSSCRCVEAGGALHSVAHGHRWRLPKCSAVRECRGSESLAQPPPPKSAAIVIIYSFNRSRVRYTYHHTLGDNASSILESLRAYSGQQTPLAAYLRDMILTVRLVLSLRAVGTVLPVKLLAGGERHARFERVLTGLGVEMLDWEAPPLPLPTWANGWHAASFAKLAALWLRFDKVLVLDTDAVVFRNIDHIAAAPAPAFAFHVTRCTKWELNSGVAVLAPSAAERARLLAFVGSANWLLPERARVRAGTQGDGGDQSVWKQLFARVHELPAGYNARKSDNFTDWSAVHVLHDIWETRWSKWWDERAGPDLVARLRNLTVTATKLVAAVDDISSAPRLGDAYETSARLAAGPARVCYTHRMRACAWDAWPTPLV